MNGEESVEIGYNSRLAAVTGVAAAVVALLLWVRALGGGSAFDAVVAVVLSLVAVGSGVIAIAGRAPLLVADRRGVRAKIGGEWCGFPWVSISEVHVDPRRFPWSDGRLLIAVQHPSHLTESLSPRSQRRLLVTQRRHHAEISLPLGAITGVSSGDERQLVGRLGVLKARAAEPDW